MVTIDKKSEKIIIKEKSNIIEEIYFSDINRIEIKKHFSGPDDTLTWKVNLIKSPFQGGFTTVYYANSESEAKRIAEKISKITNREIVRRYKK